LNERVQFNENDYASERSIAKSKPVKYYPCSMSIKPIISLQKLTKSYGKSRGIENISFDVMPGEVFGFLGPNGAGKTTAIRTLVGLIHATSGSAQILGHNALASSVELRKKIGYLPGVLSIYKGYTAWQYLQFIAKMRGRNCDLKIIEYAKRLNLDLHKHISELSKGNRQKVGVIQAFMHQPEVLFLDEPTSGLDPIVQREFESILDEAKLRGAAVMLSSHVLSEVEHLADRVAIINEGKLIVVEKISVLKERAPRTIDLYFNAAIEPSVFDQVQGIKDLQVKGTKASCTIFGSESQLLTIALRNGLETVRTHEPTLDEIFLSLVTAGKPQ
jgi:ABC-2 type transport system ATP-binding protein